MLYFFNIFLTVHLGTICVNNQLDALFNVFISLLYMFRVTQCSSSGESIVSIHHLVYITLCRWPYGRQVRGLTCIPNSHLHRVIYTRWCIDTIGSPDDEHCVARNMYRSEINTLKKCVKLIINTKDPCMPNIGTVCRWGFYFKILPPKCPSHWGLCEFSGEEKEIFGTPTLAIESPSPVRSA